MFTWLWRKLIRNESEPEHFSGNQAPLLIDDIGIMPEEVFYNAASRFLDVQISTNDVFDDRTSMRSRSEAPSCP